MKWLNGYGMKLVLVGVVAAMVTSGGQTAIADFVLGEPVFMDEAINARGTTNTQGHSLLPNGLKLYFSARRGDKADGHTREIWVSERESLDAPWGEAVNLGPNINRPGATETYPTISPDDLELYFIAPGWQQMRSTRASTDEPWGPAVEYTGIYPDEFSSDGLEKYTYDEWDGGYGGWDIWVTKRATIDDNWGEPVNLGPNVNHTNDQWEPSISNDGLALFFSDYGGGHYVCVRTTREDDWGPRINLGLLAKDGFLEVSPDGRTLYFESSSRLNSLGLKESFWQVSIKPIIDLNGDGNIDTEDLLIMMDNWGSGEKLCDIGPMPWGDGIVDIEDLTVFIKYWEQENMPENPEDEENGSEVPEDDE